MVKGIQTSAATNQTMRKHKIKKLRAHSEPTNSGDENLSRFRSPDEDSPQMKVFKAVTSGFVAGTIWGTIVATWHDVPRVERNVALPGLIRTLKMMGNHGVTFAAIGGVYIGVEQLVQHYRMKRDFINGAIGGFAAGAIVLGYRAKSISTAISAGAALAATSAIIDVGGKTTRVDNGKEYYPYTTKKRSPATES
ncbi:hypothetical protein Droror1_Dr00002441 [Drosera rotundifolia]